MVNGTLKRTLHPNRITASSIALSAVGLGLINSGGYYDVLGLALVLAGSALDIVDGRLARSWNLQTQEGAKLDPLADKVKNLLVGGYVIGNELAAGRFFLPVAVATNFVVDYFSQRARGDLADQVLDGYRAVVSPESCAPDLEINSSIRANNYGKAKVIIQTTAGLAYLGVEVLRNHYNLPKEIDSLTSPILGTALIVSALLGVAGIVKRRKNKKASHAAI